MTTANIGKLSLLGLLVVALTAQTRPQGIFPKQAEVRTGYVTYFTMVSKAPISSSVLSRDSSIARLATMFKPVQNADSTITTRISVSGRRLGSTWIVAKYYNGKCIVRDSALVTVRRR